MSESMHHHTAPPSADMSLDALAQQAVNHLAQGGRLGDIQGLDEYDYEMLYALGHGMYTQGRYADAARVFGFGLLNNHLDRRFTMAYASALQMSGEWAAAIPLYMMAAVMDMNDPHPCFHSCECLLGLGQKAQACEGLAIVVRQCGDAHPELRERAQAMLQLLSHPDTETQPGKESPHHGN
ncbi:MAG: SycD/LcrH family type III secretion system chaperone [Ramlibacter sp.]